MCECNPLKRPVKLDTSTIHAEYLKACTDIIMQLVIENQGLKERISKLELLHTPLAN